MVTYNRLKFTGCCAIVDTLSDGAPHQDILGLGDHPTGRRIKLKREALEVALPTLVGMPVNAAIGLDKHGHVVGYVESAWITNTEVLVSGNLWPGLHDGLVELINSSNAGMSLEFFAEKIARNYVKNFWFNGVAILDREKAAYKRTWVTIDAR